MTINSNCSVKVAWILIVGAGLRKNKSEYHRLTIAAGLHLITDDITGYKMYISITIFVFNRFLKLLFLGPVRDDLKSQFFPVNNGSIFLIAQAKDFTWRSRSHHSEHLKKKLDFSSP